MARKFGFTCYLTFALLCVPVAAGFCQDAASGADEDSRVNRELQQQLLEKPKAPALVILEKIKDSIPKPKLPEGATMIKEVRVTGATILAPQAVQKLKKRYSGRELTAREMQRAADLVTRAYNREGFITSYAYIDTGALSQEVLQINVVEGRVGKVSFEGNKFYSDKLLRKKIRLKEGQLFDFRLLNQDVFKINKHPDRKVSMVIDPDVAAGTADIKLKVKDRSPFHVTLQADNYGSQYILYRRYKTFFTHNNLTGHDDSLTVKLQATEAYTHKLFDFDYFIPLNNDWKFEFYLMPYKKENYVDADNQETDFEKHAWKWYFVFYNYLIDRPDLEFVSSYGFVFKQIDWHQYGKVQAKDHFRGLMWGLDLNRVDKWGRWVISNDFEIGVPRFMGGATHKDDITSVNSAGGGYKKNHLVVARRHKLVYDMDLLAKAHWQVSSMALTGVNVFSVGGFMGVIDNRGFPRAQNPGDAGRSLTLALAVPPYGVDRGATVPGSKTKIYDAIRIFPYWDYALAIQKAPNPGVPTHNELQSAGVGMEFKVPDKALAVRVDLGWPVSDDEPKDGDGWHLWWAITKGF